jgi:putative hydrolase
VQTPAQKVIIERLTALMTLLEGHAEFVLDGVGPEVVPSVEEIRARFNKRRESHNPIERVVRRLLGIEMKMRQYAEGHKFVQTGFDHVNTPEAACRGRCVGLVNHRIKQKLTTN